MAKCTFVGMLLLFTRLTMAARKPNDNCVCKQSNKAIEAANEVNIYCPSVVCVNITTLKLIDSNT